MVINIGYSWDRIYVYQTTQLAPVIWGRQGPNIKCVQDAIVGFHLDCIYVKLLMLDWEELIKWGLQDISIIDDAST